MKSFVRLDVASLRHAMQANPRRGFVVDISLRSFWNGKPVGEQKWTSVDLAEGGEFTDIDVSLDALGAAVAHMPQLSFLVEFETRVLDRGELRAVDTGRWDAIRIRAAAAEPPATQPPALEPPNFTEVVAAIRELAEAVAKPRTKAVVYDKSGDVAEIVDVEQ